MKEIYYIERKSDGNENYRAWITTLEHSKSGKLVYFMGKTLTRRRGSYNYIDKENKREYLVSNIGGNLMFWAKSRKIMVDKAILQEYLELTGQTSLPKSRYEIVDLKDEKENL